MVNNQYDSESRFEKRDVPKGRLGRKPSKERIEISKNVNLLGDSLTEKFPITISVRGTVSMGLVYRVEKRYEIKQNRKEFNKIIESKGFEFVKEDIHFIYLRKL